MRRFALQQRALGRDNPDTVTALMHLALQVSDQGRFAEADTLFRQAAALAPRASDKAAVARLQHYQALHALNQGRKEQALALLGEAEKAYAAVVPAETLQACRRGRRAAWHRPARCRPLPSQQLMIDPTAQSALIGLIEVRRYRAIVLRQLGRPAESEAAIASAEALARANQMGVPLVSARLTRTWRDDRRCARGNVLVGGHGFSTSSPQNFTQVVPRTRPVAETALLQAGARREAGQHAAVPSNCAGPAPRCCATCAPASTRRCWSPAYRPLPPKPSSRPGERQALLRADVRDGRAGAGQRDQPRDRRGGGAAGRQCARSEGGRGDPSPAGCRGQAGGAVSSARRAGGQRAARQRSRRARRPARAELDRQIVEAQAELADADAALQTASPNYGQLVQQVVPAADVLAALRSGRGAGRDHAHAAWRLELPVARPARSTPRRSRATQPRSLRWSSGCGRASNRPLERCRNSTRRQRGRCTTRRSRRLEHAARRRKGVGGRTVRGAAVAAVRGCC